MKKIIDKKNNVSTSIGINHFKNVKAKYFVTYLIFFAVFILFFQTTLSEYVIISNFEFSEFSISFLFISLLFLKSIDLFFTC